MNKEQKKEYNKEYNKNHKEQKKEYHENYKEQIKEQRKEYNKNHKEQRKEYCENNKEQIKEQRKEYRKNNKEQIKKQKKEYYENHKEQINGYNKNKYATDIQFWIRKIIRSRLGKALKGNYKSGSAVKDLGCSIAELKLKLEQQFYSNPKTGEMMTWQNRGFAWHIDHIKPLASFDLEDRAQLLQACHYTNLQPLWAEENLSKGSKLI